MMDEYLSVEEAAHFLKVKISTIYAWKYQRKIPFRKHGRKLVFSKQELIRWSDQNQENIANDFTSCVSSGIEAHPLKAKDDCSLTTEYRYTAEKPSISEIN